MALQTQKIPAQRDVVMVVGGIFIRHASVCLGNTKRANQVANRFGRSMRGETMFE